MKFAHTSHVDKNKINGCLNLNKQREYTTLPILKRVVQYGPADCFCVRKQSHLCHAFVLYYHIVGIFQLYFQLFSAILWFL